MDYFRILHVNTDQAFRGAYYFAEMVGQYSAEIAEEYRAIEFVVGPMVTKETYRQLRNKMILNNLCERRRDKIRNPRPIGNDEPPPKIVIQSVEDLMTNYHMRGTYWFAQIPWEIPVLVKLDIINRAQEIDIDFSLEFPSK